MVVKFISQALIILIIIINSAQADQPIDNPTLERQAQQLFHNIRCVVCSGQSLAESNAEFAEDIRTIVRTKIQHGETNQQIEDFLTSRYGQQILFSPPFNTSTFILWCGPFILLALLAIRIVINNVKHNKPTT